ncbi:MAG: HK97 gp10 family phage protein [Dechloromonas sp.]|nr:HK97 gp10 family phage protein [Dechloromonas sp.]
MNRIDIRIDSLKATAAFRAAPDVMERHVDGGLMRGAAEIAGEAKRKAPKSLSNLANSVIFGKIGPLTYEVRPGVDYALWVESGSGPAAGHAKYYPNPDNLLAYLMTSPRARGFDRWSRSERGRLEQEMVIARRAQAFAWWIYQHGTRPQPFMAPAAQEKRSACEDFVRAAVDRGIAEVFGAGTVRERWERRTTR